MVEERKNLVLKNKKLIDNWRKKIKKMKNKKTDAPEYVSN